MTQSASSSGPGVLTSEQATQAVTTWSGVSPQYWQSCTGAVL